jgi:uncharacterized protein related to proFAR isomerase
VGGTYEPEGVVVRGAVVATVVVEGFIPMQLMLAVVCQRVK